MTIYPGQQTSDVIQRDRILYVTVNGSALLERFFGGERVEKATLTSSTQYGPYAADMAFKLTCISGSASITDDGTQWATMGGAAAAMTQTQVNDAIGASRRYERSVVVGASRISTLGASITNGSASTNAGVYSYTALLPSLVSQRVMSRATFFGYPGQTPEYISSMVDSAVSGFDILILGPDFGTNIAESCTTSTVYNLYGQYVMKCFAAARSAGIRFAVCKTLPQGIERIGLPIIDGIRIQNNWLVSVAEKRGIDIIDTHEPLIDQATGFLQTSFYDTADPVHPTNAGHAALAGAISEWISANVSPAGWPVGAGLGGLITNPICTGSGTVPDNYSSTVFPSPFTGTVTRSIVARTSKADLPIGRWYKCIADATAVASASFRTGAAAFTVVPGERLLCCGYIKSEGSGSVVAAFWNNTTSAYQSTLAIAVNGSASVPFMFEVTVPAGCTSARLIMQITPTAGSQCTGYMGACDVLTPDRYGW